MARKSQRESEIQAWLDYAPLAGWPMECREGPDPPDVVCKWDDRCVGIEVREILQGSMGPGGSSLRAREARWDEIARAIHDRRRLEGRHLDVSLTIAFDGGRLPNRGEISSFIDQLFNIANGARENHKSISQRALCEYPLLKEYCGAIEFRRCGLFLEWDSDLLAVGARTTDIDLCEMIADKIQPRCWFNKYGYRILLLEGLGRGSSVVGIRFDHQLAALHCTTSTLSTSAYDEFGVVAETAFRWKRNSGWEWLKR